MYNKYHNKKVLFKGEKFDSKRELNRYLELLAMQKNGLIDDLERQKKYVLIPTQREPDIIGARGGRKPGKLIEKECAYIADFVYREPNGLIVVEDAKGMRTEGYKIKKKLMLYIHGIRIREV